MRRWRNRKAQAIREQSWDMCWLSWRKLGTKIWPRPRKRTVVLQENELIVTVPSPPRASVHHGQANSKLASAAATAAAGRRLKVLMVSGAGAQAATQTNGALQLLRVHGTGWARSRAADDAVVQAHAREAWS